MKGGRLFAKLPGFFMRWHHHKNSPEGTWTIIMKNCDGWFRGGTFPSPTNTTGCDKTSRLGSTDSTLRVFLDWRKNQVIRKCDQNSQGHVRWFWSDQQGMDTQVRSPLLHGSPSLGWLSPSPAVCRWHLFGPVWIAWRMCAERLWK